MLLYRTVLHLEQLAFLVLPGLEVVAVPRGANYIQSDAHGCFRHVNCGPLVAPHLGSQYITELRGDLRRSSSGKQRQADRRRPQVGEAAQY